jgi:hypothetical protein
LCAGLQAADLPPRDGSELLGSSCPRARRHRARSLCEHRPSSRECVVQGTWCAAALPRAAPLTFSGCAGRTWRGRACLRHGCGPLTPPSAPGLAVGQPSSMGGRRDALELSGDHHFELAVAAQNVWVCEPGFIPRVSLQVGALVVVPRCAGGVGLVPGYRVDAPCAERERMPGRRTPAPCHGQTSGRQATVPRYARRPPG